MEGYAPNSFPIPKRYQKGFHRLFNTGVPSPFYYTNDIVREGQPVYPDPTVQDLCHACVKGSTHGTKSIGLTAQFTYDDTAWGELRNYHFANNTGQRIDGQPILILCGNGYGLTTNYIGTPLWGANLYVGPSGYMEDSSGGAAAGDKLPIVCEGQDQNVDNYGELQKLYIRIRYNFDLGK